MFARAMNIPAWRGDRNDIAYFAHFEDFVHDEVPEGQIIISALKHGWSWRIPLQGRLSVGVVINKEAAKALGSTPEERIENAIKTEPLLKEKGMNARRVTDVMTYTNYQLISQRGHGPGWAMLGDAYGFVDPMLSPGLFHGARRCAPDGRVRLRKGARHFEEAQGPGSWPGEVLSAGAQVAQQLARADRILLRWPHLPPVFRQGAASRCFTETGASCAGWRSIPARRSPPWPLARAPARPTAAVWCASCPAT